MSLAESFKAWIKAAASRDKAGLSTLLCNTVTYNDLPPFHPFDDLDAFIASTISAEIHDTEVDALVVDPEAGKLTARLIHFGPEREDGSRGEWSKIVFVWFEDGKVSRVRSLADTALLAKIKQGAPTQTLARSATPSPEAPLLSRAEIDKMYLSYIASLTAHTVHAEFPRLVADQLTHDVTTLSREIFADLVEGFSEEIEGLAFDLKDLVLDSETQQIGALVGLSGLPKKKFRGVEPTGKPARFDEYCIYTLKGGKIRSLWSVWDVDTYNKCLSGEIEVTL